MSAFESNFDNRCAALSFTGGKDSILALHKSLDDGIRVVVLVIFSPTVIPKFKAHSFEFICLQAQSLGIPHIVCTITGPDFLESYRGEISCLKHKFGITHLITGDILNVANNFMGRAVEGTGVDLIRPLWQLPQIVILEELWIRGINVIITCISLKYFLIHRTEDQVDSSLCQLESSEDIVKRFVGQTLDREFFENVLSKCGGVDFCGENGEYHTMCVDCPLFTKKIDFSAMTMTCAQDGTFGYLHIDFHDS